MINKIGFFLSLLFFSCKTNDSNLLEINQNHNANNVLLIVVDDMGLDATVGYNVGDQKPSMPIVQDLIKSNNTNFKGVGQPLRIALTGSKFGPGIYDIILSLGKEEVQKRLSVKIA